MKKDVSLLLCGIAFPLKIQSTCYIKITLSHHTLLSASLLKTEGVSRLLGCPVFSVVKINVNTLKAKIPKECVHTALL